MAAGTGNVDSARLLHDYAILPAVAGKENGWRGKLHDAALKCDYPAFAAHLKNIDAENEFIADLTKTDGTTILMTAAFGGCDAIIELVLKMDIGGDIDQTGYHGLTALHIASTRNHASTIKLLAEQGGANIMKAHKFAGTTALHMAAELNQSAAVEALCLLGADPNAITSTGGTSLHSAAHAGAGRAVVISLVTQCHANPDALLNEDTTPLYLAAQFGFSETIRV